MGISQTFTPVLSVNGERGIVQLTKDKLGLGNVANVDTSTTANIIDVPNKRFITDLLLEKLKNIGESSLDSGIREGNINSITEPFIGAFDAIEGDVPAWGTTGMRYALLSIVYTGDETPVFFQMVGSPDYLNAAFRTQINGIWSDYVEIGQSNLPDTVALKDEENTFTAHQIIDQDLSVKGKLYADTSLQVYEDAYVLGKLFLAGRIRNHLGANIEFGDATTRWMWMNAFTKNWIFGKETDDGGRLQVNGNVNITDTFNGRRIALTEDVYVAGTLKPHMGGDLKFGKDGVEFARFIAANGRLLIGKTIDTGEMLQIEGSVRVKDSFILNNVDLKLNTRNITIKGFTKDTWYDLITDINTGTYLIQLVFSPGDNGASNTYGIGSSGVITWPGGTNESGVEIGRAH